MYPIIIVCQSPYEDYTKNSWKNVLDFFLVKITSEKSNKRGLVQEFQSIIYSTYRGEFIIMNLFFLQNPIYN